MSRPPYEAERDFAYCLWVKTLPCLLRDTHEAGPCMGIIQAAHAGERPGTGLKAPDRTTVPLCVIHHIHLDQSLGMFEPMTEAQRMAWRMAAIVKTQRLKDAWESADF